MKLTIAHSPDSDDAFMHYALVHEKVDLRGYTFTHVMEDIETLNQKADKGVYDITAVSIHAYAFLQDRYQLLTSGASMAEAAYGPCVVAKENLDVADLVGQPVAIPGKLTSAWLAMQMAAPGIEPVFMPFDEIEKAVQDGKVKAGLLIHEGQLTYQDEGLKLVLNLGTWWYRRTALPLPLGGNCIKRSLGEKVIKDVAEIYEEGIKYAIEHKDEALDHAMTYARGLDRAKADTFIGMYVNRRTMKWDNESLQSVRLFLAEAHRKGLVPSPEVSLAGVS